MTDVVEILLRLEGKMDLILQKLDELDSDQSIGDWITEQKAIKITGSSKSTLYRLRDDDELTSSTLKDKKLFYRMSDLERLLNNNEIKK